MGPKILKSFYLMLISPVLGLLMGLRGSSSKVQKALLIIFITIYGSLIFLDPGSDGYIHKGNLSYYADLNFYAFFNDLVDIITFEPNDNIQEDVYIHLISYVIGSLVGLPGLFFPVISFIYAYFFVGSIFKIINLKPELRYKWIFFGFLIVFILWKNIEGINTVRTWTGLWILFYSSLNYFETRKLKYAIFMFVAPLCHFGYFIMAIPAWIVLLVGPRPYIFSVLFGLSFFVNLINPETAANEIGETSELASSTVKGYYVEEQQTLDQKLASTSSSTWYKQFSQAGIENWATSALAIVIIFSGFYFGKMSKLEESLFSIGLLTKVLSSASWFIFALANRSNVVSGIFILSTFILIAQRGLIIFSNGKFPTIQKISYHLIFFALIPFIFLRLSQLLDFISLYIFSTPFVVWLFGDINISIKDAIKYIFSF